MTSLIDVNTALDKAEEMAERLIRENSLNRDDFEHDLFYGNPDMALTDIFSVMKKLGLTLPREEFDRAFIWIERLQGREIALLERREFEQIAV